ncbi:MAG TPA: tail fiber domain-containing protein, partial [Hyphomicrobiaceae bacterium]|nr:tail fiber domain-containing protein [Hyphomicrobiaceae bacterium]
RMSCLSDRNAKENITRVGTHSLGIGLYLFDYKFAYRLTWGYARQFGVMADEVEKVLPEAVCTQPDGYKMVDYAMLGIDRDCQ